MIDDILQELGNDGWKVDKKHFLFHTEYCLYRKGVINTYLDIDELLSWYEGYINGKMMVG